MSGRTSPCRLSRVVSVGTFVWAVPKQLRDHGVKWSPLQGLSAGEGQQVGLDRCFHDRALAVGPVGVRGNQPHSLWRFSQPHRATQAEHAVGGGDGRIDGHRVVDTQGDADVLGVDQDVQERLHLADERCSPS